jgi:hypothetical protein
MPINISNIMVKVRSIENYMRSNILGHIELRVSYFMICVIIYIICCDS